MATRAFWSGRIKLALVSIPIQLIPATKSSSRISFHQVHKPSGKRVRYEKIVPGLGPIDTDEIVKGYEVEKGKYVLLTDEEIGGVKLEAKKTIELVQFVDQHEIDPIYFERPFFVSPDEDNEDAGEAYVVLREALRRTKKVGLGQIVVRGQGSIVALKPCGKGLLLETLRYPDEIKKKDTFFKEIPTKEADKDLVGLAEELIERRSKAFDPQAFKDSYTVALHELIAAKREKRAPLEIEEPQHGGTVIDLMEALKRSVGRGDGGKRKVSPTSRPAARRNGARRKAA